MSIIDISKTLMYKFWYDYIKPKYGDRAKLRYTDTDRVIIYIKTEDLSEDISNDVERCFDTSNYDENDKRPLPIGKNKEKFGLSKDELGKINAEVVAFREKTYTYLIDGYGDNDNDDDDDDDDNEKNEIINKKAERTKNCVMKCKFIFTNYKDCLFNDETILRSQQIFKSYHHKVYTEQV